MKILIVDDSSTFRAIARKELEEEGGYEIIEAEDGEIALETLMSTPVNLVTMDVEMPGLNGYEVCKKMRSEEYSSKIIGSANNPLPLIFITGNDSLEERAKGFEAGAADFITKPFLSGELLASVDRLLKPENKFKGLTALVADDSQVVRFIVAEILKKEGISVIEAADGNLAYEIIRDKSNEIDLIITDVVMPNMKGDELCAKVRKELNIQDIPIIFLTGIAEKSYMIDMFKAGGTDYLIKPFIKEELIARLDVHLNVRQLNKQLHRNVIKLKKLSKMKDKFLSICSHDLRSPITTIFGFTDLLLQDSSNPEETKDFLRKIKSSAKFLLTLVNNLLDLRRIQSESTELDMKPIRLYDLVKESVSSMQPLIATKGITIKHTDSTPETMKISGDRNGLIRVINNLLSNAIKFTPKNGTIQLLVEPQSAEQLAFSVIDSGMGIAKDKIPQLFTQFSKVSRPGTEGERGTGLGLSITKEIIEKHGGKIEVSSEEGKGSLFRVLIPALTAAT